MKNSTHRISSHRLLASVLTLLFFAPLTIPQHAQEDETTRHLWDTAFINKGKKRPSARKRRSYRIATPQVPTTGVSPDTVVGITLWRLRPSRATDAGERIIDHENPDAVEWLPERVSADRRLDEGDRIRLSIEAARTGYLYVIDQEQYADGSKGEPYLIFPTSRTRNGDNSVKAGRVIEIPAQDDSPPFFTLKRTRADHVGENVIVIVTPTPIEGVTISEKAQRLSADTVTAWEKSWGAQSGRLEMDNSTGQAWTKAEKEAGADATRSLTEAEPAPQTIYYRPGVGSSTPVLVKVEVRYARPAKRRS